MFLFCIFFFLLENRVENCFFKIIIIYFKFVFELNDKSIVNMNNYFNSMV